MFSIFIGSICSAHAHLSQKVTFWHSTQSYEIQQVNTFYAIELKETVTAQ